MKKLKHLRRLWLLPALLLVCAVCLAGCSDGKKPPDKPQGPQPVTGTFFESDYLKVSGTDVRKERGEGDRVMLRGTNAGGYLLVEQWMTALKNTVSPYYDHKRVTEDLTRRFGADKAAELWSYYRDVYWTDADFANCAAMGMTVLRLPFTYMNVDFGTSYDFSQLDKFVEGAAKYGIYTILDLHGAYGSQNGKDHSGEIVDDAGDVDFYSNEEKMTATTKLWTELARHYKDNPAVAAFDLLNEPGEHAGTTSKRHWDFFDRAYDAVRSVDPDRIVIFESCWDAVNLPDPASYGWENCMYSYHQYAGTDNGTGLAVQGPTYRSKINGAARADYGVPNYMGEFNCYDDQQTWEYVLKLMNDNGWHWTSWTYKVNSQSSPWGIYNTRAQKADPAVDGADEIKSKWAEISTAAASAGKYVFKSEKTLFDVMKEGCTAAYAADEG